ncbi:MAG: hypothetical protein F8N37_11245 [Telmatospirillum sp.]|nr:hypothetical protein [Telmatospirillum sp.]
MPGNGGWPGALRGRAIPPAVSGGLLACAGPGVAFASEPASVVARLRDRLSGACWACDTLEQVGGQGLDMAQALFDRTGDALAAVLGVFMGLWLLLLSARMLLPFGPASSGLGNQGARKLAAFAIVLGFLQSRGAVWDYLLTPIVGAGAEVAGQLVLLAKPGLCAVGGGDGYDLRLALTAMRCPLTALQEVFSRGILTGIAMVSGAGWHGWLDFLRIWTWSGRLLQILSGLLLALVHFIGFLSFPLFFVDALMRTVIIATLSPLCLAASLFGPVRQIVSGALAGLARAAMTVVCGAIAAGLAVAVMDGIGPGGDGGSAARPHTGLVDALEDGRLSLTLTDSGYWMLLGAGVFTICLVRSATRIAGALVGPSMSPFSGSTGGLATLAGGAAGFFGLTVDRLIPGHRGGRGRRNERRRSRRSGAAWRKEKVARLATFVSGGPPPPSETGTAP